MDLEEDDSNIDFPDNTYCQNPMTKSILEQRSVFPPFLWRFHNNSSLLFFHSPVCTFARSFSQLSIEFWIAQIGNEALKRSRGSKGITEQLAIREMQKLLRQGKEIWITGKHTVKAAHDLFTTGQPIHIGLHAIRCQARKYIKLDKCKSTWNTHIMELSSLWTRKLRTIK